MSLSKGLFVLVTVKVTSALSCEVAIYRLFD